MLDSGEGDAAIALAKANAVVDSLDADSDGIVSFQDVRVTHRLPLYISLSISLSISHKKKHAK
jgi:hypothetical protein